jgi:hypothetical protein
MNRGPGPLKRILPAIRAMATLTFRESRSPLLTLLILLGGLLVAWAGLRLPSPLEGPNTLAGAFFFGGISLVLILLAMVSGAHAMAADRGSGFHGFLLSKPLSGPVYFLGRFAGLAARLTLTVLLAMLLGGAFLQLLAPELAFSTVQVADRATIGSTNPALDDKLLLVPGGPEMAWVFPGPDEPGSVEVDLRFRFRPRFRRGGALDASLPLKISLSQGDRLLLDDEFRIINRKSLDLSIRLESGRPVRVTARVPGGVNALEITGDGCTLALGKRIPLSALLLGAAGSLPVLYLALAVALMFSAMVSIPTAFFSTAVLSLLVLMGPSLQAEFMLSASHGTVSPERHGQGQRALKLGAPPPQEKSIGLLRAAARFTAKALSLLPDPRKGSVVDPLSRNESPRAAEMLGPWKDFLPHILLSLVLGCLLAGRRVP